MADVTLEATILSATARGYRATVFTTALIGYAFYVDATANTLKYLKTSDGGGTWAAGVAVSTHTIIVAFDVWYDQWTTGRSGTLIHIFYFDETTDDDVHYRALDTNGDTLGTERTIVTRTSAVAGVASSISGTVAESGYIYACYNIDGGTEFGFQRSTDSGATWSADLGGTFNEGSSDHFLLFPAHGTGDTNDIWAIYQDNSALAMTMKMWDSSAAAQVESSTCSAIVTSGTDLTIYQYPFSGSIRQSDGHLIWTMHTERDTVTSDHIVFDVSAVNSGTQTGITAKTNITTDIDDHYTTGVFIDQNTNNIYVAYVGKRDGSETLGTSVKVYYTKSTDGGSTWSAGDTAYMEGAATIVLQIWTPISGSRFYVHWRPSGTGTLIGNKVNSVDVTPVGGARRVFIMSA